MARMTGSKNLRRRRFLQAAAATAATLSCGNRKGPWRFLTIEEARTLAAICDRLIPADADPGAAWAGGVNFIDRHLAGHNRKYQRAYRQGLIGIDHLSISMRGKRFAELDAAAQDAVLAAMEEGRSPEGIWPAAQAREFFNLALAHTMQSFYGDPRHGGNREAASWRMLRIPVIPVRGRRP